MNILIVQCDVDACDVAIFLPNEKSERWRRPTTHELANEVRPPPFAPLSGSANSLSLIFLSSVDSLAGLGRRLWSERLAIVFDSQLFHFCPHLVTLWSCAWDY